MSELIRDRYQPEENANSGYGHRFLKVLDRQENRTLSLSVHHIRSDDDRNRIMNEARRLPSIRPHPGIPTLRDDFFEGDRYYIARDWIEGQTLEQILQGSEQGRVSTSFVVDFLKQAAEILHHLHGHDPAVVHGSVRPDMFVIDKDAKVFLIGSGVRAPHSAAAVSTLEFQAPEATEQGSVSAASDVYSLAALAHTLLTGNPPKGGSVSPGTARLTEASSAVLEGALSQDPSARPHSAPEFVEQVLDTLRAGPPAGVVTMLSAEVAGSGKLSADAPEPFRKSLNRLHELLDSAFAKYSAYRPPNLGKGDSSLAVFDVATEAMKCAVDIQLAVNDEDWVPDAVISLKLSLHTGDLILSDRESYSGPALSEAMALVSLAHGGQIVVSKAARDAVYDLLPEGVTLKSLGSVRLKNTAEAQELFQVSHPSLVRDFPAVTQLPTGTITFLLTDIEGSTRMWEQSPEDMSKSLSRHEEILLEAVESNGGVLLKSKGEGDSTFSVFSRASSGLAAALAIQRGLMQEPWPESTPVKVRVGLHSGEAELREGDYFGPVVNTAARLKSIAHGEQVIASSAAVSLAGTSFPEGSEMQDLGIHRLKDLDKPAHVYQLVHPDIRSEFEPLRSLTVASNNLPTQLSAFVGRESELNKIGQLLTNARMVTIAGPGGLGKTRLSVEVGAAAIGQHPNGVWITELESISDSSLVPRAVAQALGVQEKPGVEVVDSLIDHLRSRNALLILDNCEHLLDSVPDLVVKTLSECKDVKVLATSQEPLGIEGETVWRLPPMQAPPVSAKTLKAIESFESVRFFLDRAEKVKPNFSVTDAEAESLARICRNLDGVPLALELASARVNVLTISQIDERLNDRFKLLSAGKRGTPGRHQTLEATVDWSYGLLSEIEAELFRRLGVFVGGFSLEAVENVCSDDSLDSDEVLELLAGLVDKSLVQAESSDGSVRYRLLETIRQYAENKLVESGDREGFMNRHSRWFDKLVNQATPGLRTSDQLIWLDRLENEHENIRRALAWSNDGGKPEIGLRMATGLGDFWQMRGYLTEGRDWLNKTIANCEGAPPKLQAMALQKASSLAFNQGDYDASSSAAERSLTLMRETENREGESRALAHLGNAANKRGDYERALALYEESLGIARELGDRRSLAMSLRSVGAISAQKADLETAATRFEESLALYRQLGDTQYEASSLSNLGVIAYRQGDHNRAASMWEEALELMRGIGHKSGTASALHSLGTLRRGRGEYGVARSLFEEALATYEEIGDQARAALSQSGLGRIALAQGHFDEAKRFQNASLEIRRSLGANPAIADSLAALGQADLATGAYSEAKHYFEESLALRRGLGDKLGIIESVNGLGAVVLEEGDRGAAGTHFDEALDLAWQVGSKEAIAECLATTGRLAYVSGDIDGARAAQSEGLKLTRELSNKQATASLLIDIARTAAESDVKEAEVLCLEALELVSELGDRLNLVRSLECLAILASKNGRTEKSGRMFGAAESLRETIGAPVPPSQRSEYEAAVSALADDEAFKQALEEGKNLPLDEAVALAFPR